MEFIYAPNGIIGLETAWSISVKKLLKSGKLTLQQLLEKIVVNPRKILNLEIPVLKEGKTANLTIFNTDEEWVYSAKEVRSKSRNSPYVGDKMVGRAVAIYNNKCLVKNTLRT